MYYRPGCITNPNNALELNITFTNGKRNLEDQEETIQFGVPKKYRISLNMNSGVNRTYRGKLVEENLEATGPKDYFKEVTSGSDIKL